MRRPPLFAPPFALAVLLVCTSDLTAAGTRTLRLTASAKSAPKYARIDFSLDCRPIYENPYDPAQVDLRLEVTAPTGTRLEVPAFFYQPFEHRQLDKGNRKVDWLYPVGAGQWQARFAPMEVGTHSCVAVLTDRVGTVRSEPVAFECTPSKSKGFVRVSKRDPRFFELSEGQPFFVVGQNVCYIRELADQIAKFERLGAHGLNYARLWVCCEDWALGIEARKSAWARSWGWRPPIVAMPGRQGYHGDRKCIMLAGLEDKAIALNPCHNVALRPNTRYLFTGMVQTDKRTWLDIQVQGTKPAEPIKGAQKWTRFQRAIATSATQRFMPRISFKLARPGAAWIRGLSLKEAKGGPELLWEADVNRPPRGTYNQIDCFKLDKVVEAAEKSGIRLQLCLLTRDHYMHDLRDPNSVVYDAAVADAKNLLRYAIARWGYSTHVAAWEYFNEMNPGLPLDRFYAECGDYILKTDPYRHLRATSNWHPSPKHWRLPSLDTADEHFYMRPTTKELFKNAPAAVRSRVERLRGAATNRPALLSEFGVIGDNWQPTPVLKKDAGYVHMHNALWASALSGLSGTVMHWFWDDIHKQGHYRHYRPISKFVADIPWTTAKLRKAKATASNAELRIFGLQGEGCAYVWLFNPQATWWKMGVDKIAPKELKGVSLAIDGLPAGSYQAEWWDTWKGEPIEKETVKSSGQALRLAVPTFERDIACKITR